MSEWLRLARRALIDQEGEDVLDQHVPVSAQGKHRKSEREFVEKMELKHWFANQSGPFKNLVLLQLANELTIVVRIISTQSDKELMLKAGWIVSECQHRILGYVTATMTQKEHYPDDVIVEIVFDHIDQPAIREFTRGVWNIAIDRAERFGAALKVSQS